MTGKTTNGGNGNGPTTWWEVAKGTVHGSTLAVVLWLAAQVAEMSTKLGVVEERVRALYERVTELERQVDVSKEVRDEQATRHHRRRARDGGPAEWPRD